MRTSPLKFTGMVVREDKGFSSLCPELDVASCGKTPAKAKHMLEEAVKLYLETAIENNLPYLRPVPPSDNPRLQFPESVVETFDLEVNVHLAARAA